MPEGDTLFRAAESLNRYLAGRVITAAEARDVDVQRAATSLVGRRVERVVARAKHLLIYVEGGVVVHSHMRMKGSWWLVAPRPLRPAADEVLALVAGDRMALCRRAPVVNIVNEVDLGRVPGLNSLGPDVLRGINPDAGGTRIAALHPSTPIGDALLDQRVVSGLGNIWRCEALFAARVHPATQVGALDLETLGELVRIGARLMGAAADRSKIRPAPQVYGRRGRPCRRCGTSISSRKMGRDARTAYWCPSCQVSLSIQMGTPIDEL